MQIRDAQFEQFRAALEASFETRAIAHLRKHHALQLATYSDEAIRTYVRMCAGRAQRLYGLDSEQAIVCYCQLPLILGGDFETPQRFYEVAVILAHRSLEQNTRAKIALATAYQINPAAESQT